MLFASMIATLKSRIERRKTYNRRAAEIMGLTTRDLVDLRADRSEMLRLLWEETYGGPSR